MRRDSHSYLNTFVSCDSIKSESIKEELNKVDNVEVEADDDATGGIIVNTQYTGAALGWWTHNFPLDQSS